MCKLLVAFLQALSFFFYFVPIDKTISAINFIPFYWSDNYYIHEYAYWKLQEIWIELMLKFPFL
jgi:hypothetical protein